MKIRNKIHGIRHQHRPTKNLAESFVSPCPLRIHLYVIHNTYIYIIYTTHIIILYLYYLYTYRYSSYIHSSRHDYIT